MRLTQRQVLAMFEYLPYQGILRKLGKHKSRKPITSRYVHVTIDGKTYNYTTASIIWMYMKGEHKPYVQRHDNIERCKQGLPLIYTNNYWSNFK